MILAFKSQFVEPILSGSKIHTIRHDQHNRWREGMPIQMATGVRSKNYNCFMESKCTKTQLINIAHVPGYGAAHSYIKINGRLLGECYYDENGNIKKCDQSIVDLAINDGFKDVKDFFDWFSDDFFSGYIIHWTDKRY